MIHLSERNGDCGWDDVDKVGRKTLGGDGHTLDECNEVCLNDPNCNFAAFSTTKYCHMYSTCNKVRDNSIGKFTNGIYMKQCGDFSFFSTGSFNHI
jgi:hypothetical protein